MCFACKCPLGLRFVLLPNLIHVSSYLPSYPTLNTITYYCSTDFHPIGESRDTSRTGELSGITYLEDRIFTIHRRSKVVCVFEGHPPFDRLESEDIDLKNDQDPRGICASTVCHSIFVIATEEQMISRIAFVGKASDKVHTVSCWKLGFFPRGISVSLANDMFIMGFKQNTQEEKDRNQKVGSGHRIRGRQSIVRRRKSNTGWRLSFVEPAVTHRISIQCFQSAHSDSGEVLETNPGRPDISKDLPRVVQTCEDGSHMRMRNIQLRSNVDSSLQKIIFLGCGISLGSVLGN